MALHIKFLQLPAIEIHVPISFEFASDIVRKSNQITSISADGDEHELVVQRFPNLPHGHASSHWSGEFGRFIAENFTSLADIRQRNDTTNDQVILYGFVFPKGTSYVDVKIDMTGTYYIGPSDIPGNLVGYMFSLPTLGGNSIIIQDVDLKQAVHKFHTWLSKRGLLNHFREKESE